MANNRTQAAINRGDEASGREMTHAARVIRANFQVKKSELLVSGIAVSELAETYGTPLFVYDAGIVDAKVETVRSILPKRFDLYYSIKANPNTSIIKHLLGHGCGMEIASAGELFTALHAGCTAERIIFAGPGKTRSELEAALGAPIRELHVESVEEARCISAIAAEHGKSATIALRINPTDTSGGAMRMGGQPSPFGIDEEHLDAAIAEIQTLPNVHVGGVHLFMGTQILDADILITQYKRAIGLARRIGEKTGRVDTIDFGGGWGTPYFPHEHELDLPHLAQGLREVDALMSADPLLKNTTAIIEPGRYLVNEAGIYVSRVTRIKRSRGKVFAVLDGGMHHHLAASGNLGQAVKRNYPVAVLNRIGATDREKTELVGPLCTPLDTIGRGVELPVPEPGDLIGVFLSGAYARTSSPLGFLGHATPAEVMIDRGQARLIRRRGRLNDIVQDQESSVSASDHQVTN